MNAVEIEAAVSELAAKPFDAQEFAFDFLRAFGNKETTIKKLRAGQSNSSDIQNGVLQRNHIHIAVCEQDKVSEVLKALRESKATEKAKAKFVLATDGFNLQAEDLISGDTISSNFTEFAEHFGFFLPLAGISTIREIKDNPIDVRATGRLNKLYIELLKDNPDWATEERRQDMNHFMARLIFCFFAEDTEIFQPSGIFTQTIEQMSERDSSNTHEVLQSKEGWIKHPLDDQLRTNTPNQKLRSIPVRMIFNDPDLNLRAEYTLFDRQTGRPVCVGNGETCQRLTNQGVEQLPCPSPDLCPLAQGGNCKPYGRLHVNLDESDEFGTFIFRTTGFNSIRTLAARLSYYHAASNGLLSCLPLQLILRGKSTTQSYRQPVYYVDLTLREGISLNEAIIQAKQIDEQSKQAGFYQEALDFTARKGFGNGRMDVDMEESLEVIEEFYQPVEGQQIEENQTEFNIQQGLKGSVTALN